ncbi:hypothetical protein [Falsiroseomonas sp. HW251]|uniref:hypothetical protein n=1 Tax=Falsiroseomonas sp. HW251 TaxID=3390998 RepID=UPI003D317285
MPALRVALRCAALSTPFGLAAAQPVVSDQPPPAVSGARVAVVAEGLSNPW